MLLVTFLQHLPEAEIVYSVDPSTEFYSTIADSRLVKPGSIFFAVSGVNRDGHQFIPSAVEQGAVAIVGTQSYQQLTDQQLAPPATIPYLRVANSRHALALAAAALEQFPSRFLTVIGVTGTDGKTSTASLIEAILITASRASRHPKARYPNARYSNARYPNARYPNARYPNARYPNGRVGVVTTVGARIGGEESDTGFHVTTPDAPVIQQFLTSMVEADCLYAVIESTSHGLDQRRVDAIDFDIAAVTNITHEHLDYHGTREAYVAAKALLFRKLFDATDKPGRYTHTNFWQHRCAVLNTDDEGSYEALHTVLQEESARHGFAIPVRSYSLRANADVSATNILYGADQTRFTVQWWNGKFKLESPLLGEFNVYNVLCAVTATLALGIAPSLLQSAIANFPGISGRMERIATGQSFLAIVDFAHTPVSLERAMLTLRPLLGVHADGTPGRLLTVFGSAGLRDRAKRRLMGQVSGRLADFTVITAEDPRTEDLQTINQEIAAGVREYATEDRFVIVPDRSSAIQTAINLAQPGDIVAAFGKGHERSMCFGTTEYPWSDQQAMREALIRRYVGKEE